MLLPRPPPHGEQTGGLSPASIHLTASRSDNAHAVLRPHRIRRLPLRGGIIAPYFVREEPVFVTARLERYPQMPDTIGPFVHPARLGIPVVEIADQAHLPGRRGGESELGQASKVGEVFGLERLHFQF